MGNMKKPINLLGNENGSALIIAVIIMTAILIIGMFATNNTVTELQIAGTDLRFKQAFYEADGGTEYGAQLLENNIECIGFNSTINSDIATGTITVNDIDFWQNDTTGQTAFSFSEVPNATDPITNIDITASNTTFGPGGAIQMASGYEGVGKSAGAGGAIILYKIISDRQKKGASAAKVSIEWRHVIGQEDDCKY